MTITPLFRLAGIAAAMTAFLVVMLAGHLDRRATGTEIRMAVTTYDPRDFFMGHYSILGTALRPLDTGELGGEDEFIAGEEIFVVLAAEDGNVWGPASLHRTEPSDGTFIRGRVNTVYAGRDWQDDGNDHVESAQVYASFNVERLYNPRDRARSIDRLLRDGEGSSFLILSIPADGNAVIKAIEIDGERQDFMLF